MYTTIGGFNPPLAFNPWNTVVWGVSGTDYVPVYMAKLESPVADVLLF